MKALAIRIDAAFNYLFCIDAIQEMGCFTGLPLMMRNSSSSGAGGGD
jgi:hypothetical protein